MILTKTTRQFFVGWSLFWWGLAAVCASLFYVGTLDFGSSTRIALYGIVIWLNACCFVLIKRKGANRSYEMVYREFIYVWMISYCMTNIMWEWPWIITSRFVFKDIHTFEDLASLVPVMREHLSNMYLWLLASFGSVDLRTVNHDGGFYAVELMSITNVLSCFYFYHLDKQQSKYRYFVLIFDACAPVIGTLIFSLSEVFNGYVNMTGNIADILLSLVWTQYQYVIYPLLMGLFAARLLVHDWQNDQALQAEYDD